MALMRRKDTWNPIRDLEALSNRLSRMFDIDGWPMVGNSEALAPTDWAPLVDIRENDKEYTIRAELPAVKKEDVHVTLENGIVTLQGTRNEEKEEKGDKFHRKEMRYGQFLRRFAMPDDADDKAIDASYKDGVLDITIAKTKNKIPNGKREIAVKA
jgi:HSP20 family protein